MSTRTSYRRADLMDHPDFDEARVAFDANTDYSAIVPDTGGKLRVVYDAARGSNADDPQPVRLEYVPNPNASDLSAVVNGRQVTGPTRTAKGVVRATTDVQLRVQFSRGAALDFTLPFDHPIVERAWLRSQIDTPYYGGPTYLPASDAELLAYAVGSNVADVDVAYETARVAGYYDLWRYAPGMHDLLWWTTSNLLVNPGVQVTFGASGDERLWWFNRRQSFDSQLSDARFDGLPTLALHYATHESAPVNNRIDHRADLVNNVPAAERIPRFGMGFYGRTTSGLWTLPSDDEVVVTVKTAAGQMARYASGYTGSAYAGSASALKAIPIGRLLTYGDLEELLDAGQFAQVESLRTTVLATTPYTTPVLLAAVTLPLANLETANESLYYTPQTVALPYTLNPFTRTIDSAELHPDDLVAGIALESEHLNVTDLGDLPADLGTTEQMDERLTDWPLTLRVTLDALGQSYRGIELVLEEAALASDFTPYMFKAPGGEPPTGWRHSARLYRAFTDAHTLPRHPLMPADLSGMRVWNSQTGAQVNYGRCGDYLTFLDDDGPYEVYFNRTNETYAPGITPPGLTIFPTVNLTPAELRERLDALPRPPSWGSVETWFEHRNLVRPEYKVTAMSDLLADGKDLSPYLTEFRDGSVILNGHGDFWASVMADDAFPAYVKVESGGQPISMGIVTNVRSTPYANGRSITLTPLTVSEFYDTDLDLLKREDIPPAEDELQFLTQLLRRSGYPGRLRLGRPVNETDEIAFRETAFWTAPPSGGGPGFIEEELPQIYSNSSGGSTLNELRNLLHANMLDLFDLPNGDVLVESVLPVPHKTIEEIFQTEALRYAVDSLGRWVNDPRLTLQDVQFELGEGFARVEVEGASNEVSLDIRPQDATFVQSGSTEKRVFTKSMPAYKEDSNTVPEWFKPADFPSNYPFSANYLALSAEERPWLFNQMREGSPALLAAPKAWFGRTGLTPGAGNIEVTKTEGGNRWVSEKGYLTMPISGFGSAEYAPGQTWADYLISVFSTADLTLDPSSEIVVGIWAAATGTFWSKATFEFATKIPYPDGGTLKVMPHLGTFDERFVPEWFPEVQQHIALLETRKARKARRVQNPYIASIGAPYAVQRYVKREDGLRDYASVYDAVGYRTNAASQLATWLTVREFLRSRRVRVGFAGAQHWSPNQFIAIARRPTEGPGNPPTVYDLLLVDGPSRADAGVGNEAWVNVDCVFVATVEIEPTYLPQYATVASVRYDLPVGWNGPWESLMPTAPLEVV